MPDSMKVHEFHLALRLLLFLGALLLGGCSRNKGPATYEYLKAERELGANLTVELSRYPPIQPPERPILPIRPTPQERRDFLIRQRNYPRHMQVCFNQVVERLQQISSTLEKAQQRIGRLSASGTDPAAVRLVATHEALLGDARIAFLEASEFFRLNEQAFIRSQHPDLVGDLIEVAKPAIHGYIAGGGYGAVFGGIDGLLQLDSRATQQRQQLDGQVSRFHAAMIAVERDKIAFQTVQDQASTTLSSRYFGYDWAFVVR